MMVQIATCGCPSVPWGHPSKEDQGCLQSFSTVNCHSKWLHLWTSNSAGPEDIMCLDAHTATGRVSHQPSPPMDCLWWFPSSRSSSPWSNFGRSSGSTDMSQVTARVGSTPKLPTTNRCCYLHTPTQWVLWCPIFLNQPGSINMYKALYQATQTQSNLLNFPDELPALRLPQSDSEGAHWHPVHPKWSEDCWVPIQLYNFRYTYLFHPILI